jgi:hypothetical protein
MREAVDANQWDLADQEAKKVAECLDNFHVLVVKATEECQGL